MKFRVLSGLTLILATVSMSVQATTVTGYTVSAVNSSTSVGIVATGGESALGNGAIKYFIPLGNDDGVYGVSDGGDYGTTSDVGNGGGLMTMFLRFDGLTAGVDAEMNIFFEDLDLEGVNDPTGFFESIDVQDENGNSLTGGTITGFDDAGPFTITGDSDTQQVLNIGLSGAMISNPLFAVFEFASNYSGWGQNTPEYLIAEITQPVNPVPLPATIWLLGAGLASLAFGVRRKKQS